MTEAGSGAVQEHRSLFPGVQQQIQQQLGDVSPQWFPLSEQRHGLKRESGGCHLQQRSQRGRQRRISRHTDTWEGKRHQVDSAHYFRDGAVQ